MTAKTTKIMLSLSKEAMAMLLAMRKAPPFHDRVGAQSIVAEQAIRKLYAEWKRRQRRTSRKKMVSVKETQAPEGSHA